MEIKLTSKKVIKNGSNRLLNLPHVWLHNSNYPDRVLIRIDEKGDLVISPERTEDD